jgi:hypothetical protein
MLLLLEQDLNQKTITFAEYIKIKSGIQSTNKSTCMRAMKEFEFHHSFSKALNENEDPLKTSNVSADQSGEYGASAAGSSENISNNISDNTSRLTNLGLDPESINAIIDYGHSYKQRQGYNKSLRDTMSHFGGRISGSMGRSGFMSGRNTMNQFSGHFDISSFNARSGSISTATLISSAYLDRSRGISSIASDEKITLETLPISVWTMVCAFLQVSEVALLPLTSKKLKKLSELNCMWDHRVAEIFGGNSQYVTDQTFVQSVKDWKR